MMKMRQHLFLSAEMVLSFLAGGVILSGCEKEPEKPDGKFPNRIVFGYFQPPSSCFGENCIEIFSMESGKLMEDSTDELPGPNQFFEGDFSIELSAQKYRQIMAIFSDPVPDVLLDYPSGMIGVAPEWTTNYYFEYHSDVYHGHWILDGSFMGVMDPAIQQFTSVVSNAAFTAAN